MPELDVDAGAVHDIFYRHIPHGGDPLYTPPEPPDGRWQHGATIAAWYLADEVDTAWAEWYRALAELGVPPAEWLPRDLWRWRIDLERVALLDTQERLARVDLAVPQPSARQWSAYQQVGDAICREGYTALLVVSAARPEHHNLVVFRAQATVDGCSPVRPPTVISDAPTIPRGLRT